MNKRTARNATNEEFQIIVNPKKEDVSFLGKQIRFTADNRTKTVYTWPFSSGHHGDVSIWLGLKDSYSCPDVFRGAAVLENGMYRFAASDFLCSFRKNPGEEDRRFLRSLFENNWSWVDLYIEVTPQLNLIEERFNLVHEDFEYSQ